MPYDELLQRVHFLRRAFLDRDVLFRVMAESWQRSGRDLVGLLLDPQLDGTIRQYVSDLALIATAAEPSDWLNVVEFLPFQRNS